MKTELILGYDPGGDGTHGVALLSVVDGHPESIETQTFATTQDVIDYVQEFVPVAIGVDTLTCWSTGRAGWRPADRWLRATYPAVANSVMTPNRLSGSMALNGMSVLLASRRRSPALAIVETHPKVLHWALTGRRHAYDTDTRLGMDHVLSSLLGVHVDTANDHEWDAALSALVLLC